MILVVTLPNLLLGAAGSVLRLEQRRVTWPEWV
jgi:hypothetical protein